MRTRRWLLSLLILPTMALAAEPGDSRYLEAPNRVPPFDMPEVVPPTFPDRDFDIADFGAVPDARTLNTEAIANAIAACHEAGGGRVVIPPGHWLTGPIHLKSNVNLHIKDGARVFFSTNPEDYLPPVFVRWAGFELYNYSPLIYAQDCENIAITGRGILDGQGQPWWHWARRDVTETTARVYQQVLDGVPPEERIYGTPEWPLRPHFIQPINCRNILLEDFTIVSGPFWTIQVTYSENVLVRGVTVRTAGPNSDGINMDSTRNAIIEDCIISTYDDSIALKAGMNEDGLRVARPTENIIVRRCLIETSMGGVSIGSDTSGDIRNVYVHDTIFRGLWMALWIKSTRGRGGVVEDVWYENLLIDRISNFGIGISTAYQAYMGTADGAVPVIRNIHYRNIRMPYTIRAFDFAGLPEAPLENITIVDSDLVGAYTSRITDVDGMTFDRAMWHTLKEHTTAQLTNVRNLTVRAAEVPPGPDVFLGIRGTRTSDIRLEGLRFPEGMAASKIDEDVYPDVVTVLPGSAGEQ